VVDGYVLESLRQPTGPANGCGHCIARGPPRRRGSLCCAVKEIQIRLQIFRLVVNRDGRADGITIYSLFRANEMRWNANGAIALPQEFEAAGVAVFENDF